MTEYRENLIDRMIAIYGYEHVNVIGFCRLCEEFPNTRVYDRLLYTIVTNHEMSFKFNID